MDPRLEQPLSMPSSARSALWLRSLSRLPFGLLYAGAALLIVLMRDVLRWRVRIARDNLSRSFPELPQAQINTLLRAFYWQLGQVTVEFFKMASMSSDELRARFRVRNIERVHAETAAGRSVLLLAAHQCNWEWALQGTTLHLQVPLDAAYKPLRGSGSDRQLRILRCRFGAHLIAAKRLLREVVRRRRDVRAVALMADQMPASSGGRIWLKFLGRDTAFYPGPGEIAHMTGYAAFFVAMRRVHRGYYELDYQPISGAQERLTPEQFTQRYARAVEQQVRLQPANWMWLHRRWKGQPPPSTPN